MTHSQFKLTDAGTMIRFGHRRQNTITLPRPASRKAVHAALLNVAGVNATRPATVVAAEAHSALQSAGLA